MSLVSLSVTDILDAFASSAPTPGGGSAAALSGAIGASLLAMVAAMPKTRLGEPGEREQLDAAAAELQTLRGSLAALVDEDTRAYDLVTAAFKQPKATDDEKAARKQAIQSAFQAATSAPLATMRACEAALRQATVVAQSGNPGAASDVSVGVELAWAGLYGAEKNVAINIGSLTDEDFKQKSIDEAGHLLASGMELAATCRRMLEP
jgi:formiminotetrahydrofolate cyclodeaminase